MATKVVLLAVAKERAPIQQAVSKLLAQEVPPVKVAWPQLPAMLLRGTVLRAGFADAQVARLLTGAWLRHSPGLRHAVWQALQAQSYAPAGPAPDQPQEPPRRLRPADRRSVPRDDEPGRANHYFYPAGQPLLDGQQDEAVALMAYLLGWSVLTTTEEEETAPTPAADAAPPLPGDDEPALLALEARFNQLSPAETEAIPPRESALLVARSRERVRRSTQAVVARHHAGTTPPPRGPLPEGLLDSVDGLQGYATVLADDLAALADQLRRGELPATLAAAADDLAFVHTLYEAMYINMARYLGPVVLPPAEGRAVAALHEVRVAADRVSQASRGAAVRAAALHQLARLAEVRHRSVPDFAALAEVQAQGRALAAAVAAADDAALPADARALHAGTHPFATLLGLAADPDALDQLDEQSAAFESLEASLPRALVTALLLRKLELPAALAAAPAEAGAPEPAATEPDLEAGLSTDTEAEGSLNVDVDADADADAEANPEAGAWLPAVQWRLLAEAEPRLALAWHLTRAAHPPAGPLPARLLHALLLAPALHHPDAALARALAADFQAPITGALPDAGPDPLATHLLAVAAALRPALLAPATGAAAWLRADVAALPALTSLLRLVAGRESPLPLRPERGGSLSEAAWNTRMEALRDALAEWAAAAPAVRYRHQAAHPATVGWQHLLHPAQPAGELLGHLQARGPAAPVRAAVQAAIGQLQDETEVRGHLERARLVLSAGHPAWAWLLERLGELVDLASRWDYLRAIQPGRGGLSQAEAQDKAFAQQLSAALPAARQEVAALWPRADARLRAALPWAEAALGHVHAWLVTPAPAGPEPTPTALLHAPLLPYATLPLGPDGRLPAPAAAWLRALREAAAGPVPTWTEAFAAHLGRGQHQATARVLALPGAGIGASGAALALLHEARAGAMRDQRQAADARLVAVREALELAARRGGLGAAPRAELLHAHTGLLHEHWQRAEADDWDVDFAALHRGLDDIEAALAAAEAAAGGAVAPGFGPANAPFARFFPQQLRLLEQELESHPLPELLSRLAQGGTVAGTALEATGPDARAAASQALYAWEELRSERTVGGSQGPADVEVLLAFLGFDHPRLGPPLRAGAPGREVADVRTGPLVDGARCPVPAYGSAAAGQYRLVFVWRKVADAAQLLDEARQGADADGPAAGAVLLCYFNTLSEHQRHDLAAHGRQRRQTVLVLDRSLLVYLATAGLLAADRLPLFFQLTLPFAWLEPFPGTGPELFGGRQAEAATLLSADPAAPGVLLGGAGTGKTALLEHLVAAHHRPATGQLVLRLNLAELGPPERQFAALERELKRLLAQFGVLPAGMAATLSFAKALRAVRAWLRAAPGRRLVLLLDDAAGLVEHEAGRAPGAGDGLRALLHDPDAGLKLVLAAREWPLPLRPAEAVHLGPLLGPADAGAAETLLRRPLESLGVVFEDETSVSEVLVEAGYLPAQVQLLGQRLLAHLHACPLPAAGERPAHRLSLAVVREVLREAGRTLIEPALEMASRSGHHLLALRLLSLPDVHEQFAGAPGRGLRLAELTAAARHYWPASFAGPYAATEGYYALVLEQMTTAGLVLHTADGRHHLTEPNWGKMGPPDMMRAELDAFADNHADYLAGADDLAPAPARPAAPKASMLKRLTNGRRRL